MPHSPFHGNTEMARRMRALDWSRTALGPVEQWPQSLRTSVSTCLECAFPIVLWWGPRLTILYNDEYIPMLGPAKHPAALGRPGVEVWAEIWDVIDPMLSQVMTRGEPTRSRDLLLHIDRGYPEEAYFSFSYSPIHGEDGRVDGVFCPVIETTDKVIGSRRLRTLRDLATATKGAEREDVAYEAAAATLADNPHDVPFALLYRVDQATGVAERVAATGIAPRTPASPDSIGLDGAGDPWAIAEVAATGRTVLLTDLRTRFDTLPSGAWKMSAHSALVQPVLLPGQDRPRAILVTAVSPMRALDAGYRTFFELVATQLAAGLADAQALEEERRRAASLAELDRAKTAFFSNVSHEFRTPLTLMLGPIEELLRQPPGALPDNAAAGLGIAHRNSLRLLKLVNTLLDFSRIEAGRIDASFAPTDLAAFTTDLASAFRSAAEQGGLALVVDCAPLPEPVYVDRDMWEKIVLNLLSNALKFTLTGEIRLTLGWHEDHAALRVADTGIGIPHDDLPRMFERFHRVKQGGGRTHEGTGIGLALVRELASIHGGTATVESREGHGSVFTVTVRGGTGHLPADRLEASHRLTRPPVGAMPFVEEALRWLPVPSPADASPAGGPRARVLVADDNADMRDYLTHLLAAQYDVEAVADGQAALERIQAQPPDLVLSDVMMPTLDGFGLVAAIRKDPATCALPVILLSARAGEGAQIEGLGAGADQYLVKPFSARDLLARVASQLDLVQRRREAEQGLRHRVDQFETLFQQTPMGVYLVDADFTIREVNPVALPVFGDIPGGVIGREAGEILRLMWNRQYADEMVAIFRRTLETGESYVTAERAEYRIDRGTIEYYEWRADRITLPDGRYGLVCYFRDISAQVRARLTIAESERQLREADARKDEFLALLAHELRNPLAPIRTGLELIRLSGDAPETVRRVRTMIERQVTLMVRLIDDLLDVSRITSGKIVLQRRPTALAELVRTAVEAQRAAIESGQIALDIDLPSQPCVVDVDPARFVQIVSNILHNASKFTPPGGRVNLKVDVEHGESTAAVRIADTGVGMAPALLDRVFELFTQGDASSERAQGGLGIGLALARRLTEMHGGSIKAYSDGPGRGSEFVIRFPLSTAAAETDHPPMIATPRVRSRALIIDDNRDAATTMSMFVEELGGSALTAHDGASGLAAIESFHPDIVFMDIGMPGLDGYEVCRRIRQLPSQRNVVLVAVTGWGQAQDKQRAIEVGFDAHLTKPVDPDAVAQLLAGATV
ncbi:MAG TPA: ATP-binding protein [Vicinamibacterales bacterium]|nr:ATP-binding protein [Vicinamibacterales bacterium]